jgi:hypothetical protein
VPGHLAPLGQTGWSLWREGALRSTGFPAAWLLAVCDEDLARAADAAGEDGGGAGLRAAHEAAAARVSAAVARLAGDAAFRAAVAWQNPGLLGSCLDKLVRGERRNVRGRLHESVVVRYLQRYALKNDTIGFFGPVGWVTLAPEEPGLTVTAGQALVRARTTHFEVWAIDELARALASRPDLAGWLVPRPALAVTVRAGVLNRPLGPPVALTGAEAAVFAQCDGRRTVREVTGTPAGGDGPGELAAMACRGELADQDTPPGQAAGVGDQAAGRLRALARLVRLGAVQAGLEGPVDSWPERALRRSLEAVGDEAARDRALADVDTLIAARDAVAAARTADEMACRAGQLASVFRLVTGAEPARRHGEAYAGRTLVYQDTRRDAEVRAGRAVLDELAAPLGLVLDSARWLAARAGAGYRALFLALYQDEAARGGSADVPLGHLIARAAPSLTASGRDLPAPVRAAAGEFQRRWRRILDWPAGASRHGVSCAAVAAGVAREFGGAAPRWRAAVHHSPDIMIAAASPEAVRRGEFLLVLGELHLAVNSLDNRFFVQHHDDPGRLLAAAEADFGGQRVYAAPPKNSPFVSSRVWPPITLLSPQYTYWTWSAGRCSVDPPGPVLPAAALVAREVSGALRVACLDTGADYDLLEVIGEILTTAVVNSFRPVAPAAHAPRVTIGRLVIARESWQFDAAGTSWAFIKDEAARYAAARAWRARHRLPERVFAVLPAERKPLAADFTSLPLVNILAKEIRRTTTETTVPDFTLTEMLPDLPQMWLPDNAGQTYACEFRLVAVDGHAAS